MFQRFFDEGLAQASFLLGCDRTRDAIVIDPRRDADVYVAAARERGVRIVACVETHVHADFVSGARELAAGGVRVITGPNSGVQFGHEEVRDNERIRLGDLQLTFLHTPGHTPEHVTILAEQPGEASMLFTGDLLFVGGVGRPDLLGEGQARELAHQLFRSLQRLIRLADDTEIHPGHGAGSLCGAGIGAEPSSTIGRERRQNAMLLRTDEEAFVSAVLADLPETPPYFARMKVLNAAGPAVLAVDGRLPSVPPISPAAAAALIADGAILLDLREADAFADGHPAGAINIGFGPRVGYWAGWVLPPDTPAILMSGEPGQAAEAAVQLRRVGIDRIEGFVNGGYAAWRGAGLPVESLQEMSAGALRDALDASAPPFVLDVRTPAEWASDHLECSINIPAGALAARLAEVPADAPVVAVVCEGGYRSSLAASLLAREGIRPVNVRGGMAAYRAVEVP